MLMKTNTHTDFLEITYGTHCVQGSTPLSTELALVQPYSEETQGHLGPIDMIVDDRACVRARDPMSP